MTSLPPDHAEAEPRSADDVRVRASDRPPAPSSTEAAEHDFVAGLRSVGLLAELDGAEHARIAGLLDDGASVDGRRVDLLLSYYGASGDAATKARREAADRFFWHTEESPTTLRSLLDRLRALAPELGAFDAVAVGERSAPVLRLRAGGHHVDLREEPGEAANASGAASITVRAVVRATNELLALAGGERRFVPLACDGERETYVGATREIASMLCAAELVDEGDEAELFALGGWAS